MASDDKHSRGWRGAEFAVAAWRGHRSVGGGELTSLSSATPEDQPPSPPTPRTLPGDLRGAFRRFYVWRDTQGRWRARPLPMLAPDEVAFGIRQELVADTLLELAFACTWQRSRRTVHRYLREYAP